MALDDAAVETLVEMARWHGRFDVVSVIQQVRDMMLPESQFALAMGSLLDELEARDLMPRKNQEVAPARPPSPAPTPSICSGDDHVWVGHRSCFCGAYTDDCSKGDSDDEC